MAKIGRPGLPDEERRRVWELWKSGEGFSAISRQVGIPPGSVFSILRPRGGVYFPKPCPRKDALTLAEREEISRGLVAGLSLRAIVTGLGRASSTVSREVKRNGGDKRYRAVDADDRATGCRARPQRLKLQKNPVLRNYVRVRLEKYWSPEQIAGRLKRDYPTNTRMHISHEAIYHAVYTNSTRKTFPGKVHTCLRRAQPLRHGKHYTTRGVWRSQIKEAAPLSKRPAEAETREVLGHWEGDLIIGSNTSQVATIVDRTSRAVDLIKLLSRHAPVVVGCLSDRIGTYGPDRPTRTLTWDRGMELAAHQDLSAATGLGVYFADPHSPWQRGSNENTNGLVRQYLPKKTDLSLKSQAELDQIASELNTRPRKCLGYQTPLEVQHQLAHQTPSVALTI